MSFQPSKKSGRKRERAQRLNSWRPNWGEEEGDEKKNDEDKEEADDERRR